jgi:hypothetical protein
MALGVDGAASVVIAIHSARLDDRSSVLINNPLNEGAGVLVDGRVQPSQDVKS